MTIPRQIGPETGLGTALPDYSRSNATVERMVSDLRRPSRPRASTGRGEVRALLPRAAMRDTLLRAVISAMALGTSLVLAVAIMILWLTIEDGHAPRIGLLLIMLTLAAAGAVIALVGLRFAVVAVGTARSRVEITDEGLRVVGAFRARTVPWQQILAVESRVVHPVHWLTAALRLQDGSRVVMPAFDRHVWTYAQPSGQDVRTLRTEVRRREQAARRRPF
ncbi:PH domain-containing protein [Brachybacterium sp. FME24]|uniref:PH domain-containing protein n=1 Tax=Brachybacterium sp. FME24 TaxID=2742605 RepID=UPI001865B653|nr:PH domain-containing protein [Brachybacterium sp. FME24]